MVIAGFLKHRQYYLGGKSVYNPLIFPWPRDPINFKQQDNSPYFLWIFQPGEVSKNWDFMISPSKLFEDSQVTQSFRILWQVTQLSEICKRVSRGILDRWAHDFGEPHEGFSTKWMELEMDCFFPSQQLALVGMNIMYKTLQIVA